MTSIIDFKRIWIDKSEIIEFLYLMKKYKNKTLHPDANTKTFYKGSIANSIMFTVEEESQFMHHIGILPSPTKPNYINIHGEVYYKDYLKREILIESRKKKLEKILKHII